ncbi:ABC transporter ATP-binding protein [Elusimicrobiota bacterium]
MISKSFPEISIETTDLSKRLGQNEALKNLNIKFESGLLHGIIGPDGAGKTTLLRLAAGLLHPTSGSINFFSQSSKINFYDLRPHIAYMPSKPSLYPDLSVNEHLEFFADLFQIPKDRYVKEKKDLLDITRLDKFTERKAGNLSGGMYKKLGLMCALLRAPSILLLDEPTNGVDPISRREFWELLYKLAEQKILILISTAYMDEAQRCERIHLIDAGKSIVSGIPEEILESKKIRTFEELFIQEEKDA